MLSIWGSLMSTSGEASCPPAGRSNCPLTGTTAQLLGKASTARLAGFAAQCVYQCPEVSPGHPHGGRLPDRGPPVSGRPRQSNAGFACPWRARSAGDERGTTGNHGGFGTPTQVSGIAGQHRSAYGVFQTGAPGSRARRRFFRRKRPLAETTKGPACLALRLSRYRVLRDYFTWTKSPVALTAGVEVVPAKLQRQ